jgi:hypothetical protein
MPDSTGESQKPHLTKIRPHGLGFSGAYSPQSSRTIRPRNEGGDAARHRGRAMSKTKQSLRSKKPQALKREEPQPSRPARDGRINEYGWRRLPGSSRNYRNVSDPSRPVGQVISERQMTNISRERRLGEKISKERHAREVKRGARRLKPETAERQRRVSAGKLVKAEIPEITRRDAALIVKYNIDGGCERLDEDEQVQFHELFKRYPKDAVREALGSPSRRRSMRRAI